MRYIRRQTTNTQSSGIGRGVHVTPIDKEVVLDSKNSVLVKLDNSLPDNLNLHAICSDYVDELSVTYSQKINK